MQLRYGLNLTKSTTPMNLDIDKLTEAQLIDLNHRIVARLKFLQQMRTHAHMLDFSIGEAVSFQPEGREVLSGVIVKYNRKSVTILTANGEKWNVSPELLRKGAIGASST